MDANFPEKRRSEGTPKALPNSSIDSRDSCSRSPRACGSMPADGATSWFFGILKTDGATSGGTCDVEPEATPLPENDPRMWSKPFGLSVLDC